MALCIMWKVFEQDESEAVLIVDDENVHKSVNGNVFVHNIKTICPPLSRYVHICYLVSELNIICNP